MQAQQTIKISLNEYGYRFKECDGFCTLCKNWSFGNALPEEDSGVWCSQCENRSIVGVKTALKKGLIELI